MAWTERQRAMLAEMGIAVWGPAAEAARADLAAPLPLAAFGTSLQPAAVPAAPAADRMASALGRVALPSQVRLDAPALRAAVLGCTACPLGLGRHQAVCGGGHPQAHWMIVGDAPDAADDASGEPFSGAPGRLLDNMLRALGLDRGVDGEPARRAYLVHAVKCRPPADRYPEPAEIARCEPYLRRQIELVQPRMLLAMGRYAVQSLLHSSEPMGRLRGRVHDCMGVPLVVTYAPSYLLRHPEEKARAWDDLCLAWQTLQALPAAATSVPASS